MNVRFSQTAKLNFIAAGFVMALQSACAKGDDPQLIESAPPSPISLHLKSCATKIGSETGNSARVVLREPLPVCRKSRDGKIQDIPMEARFQIKMASDQSFQLFQIIAVRLEDSLTPSKSPERSIIEERAIDFLEEQCGPVIAQTFKQSGLQFRHRFLALQEGDSFAPAGVVTETLDRKMSKLKMTRDSVGMRFHLLIDVQYSQENGLELKDAPAYTISGNLTAPLAGQSQALQFCRQVALRVAENFGLTKGRDCKSFEKQALRNEEFELVKLASEEIHEVFSPVCGKMSQAASSF
jgi:hypothetical protein